MRAQVGREPVSRIGVSDEEVLLVAFQLPQRPDQSDECTLNAPGAAPRENLRIDYDAHRPHFLTRTALKQVGINARPSLSTRSKRRKSNPESKRA